MSPAEIEQELGRRNADEVVVWPEHWQVWDVWLGLENRWQILTGTSGYAYMGLDVPAVESTLNLLGVRKRRRRREIFASLRVMEEAALPILNKRSPT